MAFSDFPMKKCDIYYHIYVNKMEWELIMKFGSTTAQISFKTVISEEPNQKFLIHDVWDSHTQSY